MLVGPKIHVRFGTFVRVRVIFRGYRYFYIYIKKYESVEQTRKHKYESSLFSKVWRTDSIFYKKINDTEKKKHISNNENNLLETNI